MIVFILARARNGVIGREGRLPWHIPADLRRFKSLTMGKPMIMGRLTFESFPAPLPGRRHIVVTRDRSWRADGAEVAHDPDQALAMAGPSDAEVAVIGGAQLFEALLDRADRIELTEIHADFEGDVKVAQFDSEEWQEVARIDTPTEGDTPAYSFVTLDRRRSRQPHPPHL